MGLELLEFWNFRNLEFGIAVYVSYLLKRSHNFILYFTISCIPPSNFLIHALSLTPRINSPYDSFAAGCSHRKAFLKGFQVCVVYLIFSVSV